MKNLFKIIVNIYYSLRCAVLCSADRSIYFYLVKKEALKKKIGELKARLQEVLHDAYYFFSDMLNTIEEFLDRFGMPWTGLACSPYLPMAVKKGVRVVEYYWKLFKRFVCTTRLRLFIAVWLIGGYLVFNNGFFIFREFFIQIKLMLWSVSVPFIKLPLFFLLLIVILFYYIPLRKKNNIFADPRISALFIAIIIFLMNIWLIFTYNYDDLFKVISWLFYDQTWYGAKNFFFAVDALSMMMGLLVSVIFPIVILATWEKIHYKANFFYFNIIILELLIIGAFYTLNLFLFFILFEAAFVPMVLIVAIWGGRQRKIKAASYLFLYTLFGSVFFLTGIIYLQNKFGSTNYFFLLDNMYLLTANEKTFLWFAFFIPFAIKIPMFPFHIWLPEAHVEAPTGGSIILAAVLLKLGGYGFIRFLIPLFHETSVVYAPFVQALAILGMLYAALMAFRQTDVKKIIAYSSISHMNFIVMGIFSFNLNGLYGAVVLMIGHAFVSSGLFFLIGVLYDRYHTRTLEYFGGLIQVMPVFSGFLFFFLVSNLGFPCALSFIGEFLIFIGVYANMGIWISLVAGLVSLLNVYLCINFFTNICYGTLNEKMNHVFQDVTKSELNILILLFSLTFLTMVFHPQFVWILAKTNSLYWHLFI